MAALPNFPAIRPSLLLDFANSRRADPRLSVVRATTGTIINAAGQLEVVPANSPRIDFDPLTGRCLGLLDEEPRTNLLTYSNDFTNAAWIKLRASTVTDGEWTNLVEDNSAALSHAVNRAFTPTGSTTYTFSVDLKAKERKFAAVAWSGTAQQVSASTLYINLENGATSGGIAGSFRLTRLMGGGWRVSITTTTIAVPTGQIGVNVFSCATLGSLNYDGDGVSGIYFRYTQAEVGVFATSYIPTTTAQVTRAADAAYIDLGDTLPSAGFSVLIEGESSWGGEYPVIFSDATTALGNYVGLRMGSAGSYAASSEGSRSLVLGPRPDAFATFRAGAVFSNIPLENRVAVNGQLSSDRTAALSSINHSLRRYMKLGAVSQGANGQWHLRRVAVYPAILTAAQLQRLTA